MRLWVWLRHRSISYGKFDYTDTGFILKRWISPLHLHSFSCASIDNIVCIFSSIPGILKQKTGCNIYFMQGLPRPCSYQFISLYEDLPYPYDPHINSPPIPSISQSSLRSNNILPLLPLGYLHGKILTCNRKRDKRKKYNLLTQMLVKYYNPKAG